jgi:hypothetical protein
LGPIRFDRVTKQPGQDNEATPRATRDGEGSRPFRHPAVFRLLLLVISLGITCLIAEGTLRFCFRKQLGLVQDERSLLYRYDPGLGWFPVPNGRAHFRASRGITVVNNSDGFRAPEYVPTTKPGVLFVGDSFVWGYDVEAEERFTEKLQDSHPEWAVYNLGISGYGTDQEYLLLQKYFDGFKPRVVFLVYSIETDDDDNSTNARYGGYYKPYCTVEGNRLQLHGVPVPRSERVFFAEHPGVTRFYLLRLLARGYFKLAAPLELHNPSPTGAIIRTMKMYVESKGAVFVAGLTGSDPEIEKYLRFYGIPFVDLTTTLRYKDYGWHWTPEGHDFVARKVEEFLIAGKYLRETGTPR